MRRRITGIYMEKVDFFRVLVIGAGLMSGISMVMTEVRIKRASETIELRELKFLRLVSGAVAVICILAATYFKFTK
jgi:hypothetical protein